MDGTLLLTGLTNLAFGLLVGISLPVGRDRFDEHGLQYPWAETTAALLLGHIHAPLELPSTGRSR